MVDNRLRTAAAHPQASGLPEDAVNEETHIRLFVKKFVDSMA
jgi:hypothetical protein